jgi:dTDP-4-dehydrorhamnose reductase
MKTNRILVLGANGMLGGSIFRFFSKAEGFETLGTVRSDKAKKLIESLGFANVQSGVDALNELELAQVIRSFQPSVVINCVGIIKQLDTSNDPELSVRINSLLPHVLAKYCTEANAKLIHFSTDCVFSGDKGNYVEDDLPDASDLYGRSKLLGEVGYANHLTIRTSIIGHEINSKVSLVDWFLSQNGGVRGFSKAVFSGLPTIVVADILKHIILHNLSLSGLYHLSAAPINKFELLSLIASEYGKSIEIEEDTSYVVDKSLDSNKLKGQLPLLRIKSWPQLVKEMHSEYLEFFSKRST